MSDTLLLRHLLRSVVRSRSAGSAAAGQWNRRPAGEFDAIIAQVKAYWLPEQAAIDAVTAGLAESGLDNHETPDGQPIVTNLDSVGVFQERPSQGWGTPQQILNVGYATDQWLHHLLSVQNWQSLSPDGVAQAVERSAFPQRYQQFVEQATTWVQQECGIVSAAALMIPTSGGTSAQPSTSSSAGTIGSAPSTCQAQQARATSTLTAATAGGLRPVQLPVPAPGWQQQISLPSWPSWESAHPPTAVSNQCVAGAEWAFDAVHQSTYQFPSGNGVDVARNAGANGLVASEVPLVGDVVSFTIPGSAAGHVALVIATSPSAFEVVEQNWPQDDSYVGAWSQTDWDIRSVAWPNASVVGFAGLPESSGG